MYVKKFIAVLTLMSMMVSAVGCQGRDGNSSLSENESSVVVNEVTGTKLKNFMTQEELDRVKVGELTLLDNDTPVSESEESSDSENHNYDVKIYYKTVDDMRKEYNENKDFYTEEQYNESLETLDELESYGYRDLNVLVDGRTVCNFKPYADYDGGTFSMTYERSGDCQELTFADFEEFKVFLKDEIYKIYDSTFEDTEQIYEDIVVAWQSVIDKTYTEISLEEAEKIISENPFPYEKNVAFNGDYKDVWEYNRSEVEEIKDSVKEISIYDEELDTEFLVHVTLPPDFDESKTYPMFVLSDGVWRFGNVPSIRKLMENGEIQDIILVTIGYSYKINGTDEHVRGRYFYYQTEKTCNFIVDNLMPYLSEMYNIDCEHSGFYGHSAGGVLSHYAVFNSDKYENQPFRYYIIGSPALWELHRVDGKQNPDACYDEYGYWERNDTLDKVLFVCGGENEDPEYEEYYDEYPTTLEGISGLMERLESHGVETAECKIYEDSGHWQFIPDMFIEFFRKYYGNQSE